MNFKYSVAIMVLFSGYACATDVSDRAKGVSQFKEVGSTSHIVLGSGHHYPGKPDSEEKMVIAGIMRNSVVKKRQDLHVFRADSPYPKIIEEIRVSELTDNVDAQVQEPLCLSVKDRKDSGVSSVSSYGSMSTITLDVAAGIETPVSVDTPPVLQA